MVDFEFVVKFKLALNFFIIVQPKNEANAPCEQSLPKYTK